MSSSIGFLAYSLKERESSRSLQTRIGRSEEHLQSLHLSTIRRIHVGDNQSGFIGWQPNDSAIDWCFYSARSDAGTAWLHVPGLAGGPETDTDPWSLASAVLDGSIHQGDLGAPFAVARWSKGRLEIANDMLGLVRLFHYHFDGGDVWSTRQGLAHIFMGEEPERNSVAWSGMASVGWAIGGETQLGHGKQLIGGARIQAGYRHGVNFVEERNCFSEWIDSTRTGPPPSTTQNVRDMELVMASAKRWPTRPVADLSGGKDSRVCAAIGIRSGAVSVVRTINSDRGEVETAKKLMESADPNVQHLVVEKRGRMASGDHFLDRIASHHTAFEGRYLAASAVNSSRFSAFRTAPQARFNGLGGEVLAGGNFAAGAWHTKMTGAPVDAAGPRLMSMAHSGVAASRRATELVADQMRSFLTSARESGATTAGEALDMFYSRDRMPNWSGTFTSGDVLCPLFAPSVLARSALTMGAPERGGDLHRELLRVANPRWADVPFYKPTTAKTRSTPFIWQDSNWADVEAFMHEHIDQAESFDADGVTRTLAKIAASDSDLGKAEEVVVFRFLWDQTFAGYVNRVAALARIVRKELIEIQRRERGRAPYEASEAAMRART